MDNTVLMRFKELIVTQVKFSNSTPPPSLLLFVLFLLCNNKKKKELDTQKQVFNIVAAIIMIYRL